MSNAESQTEESHPAPVSNPSPAKSKPAPKSLIVLAVGFVVALVSAVLVPKLLQEAFYQEQEAQRGKNSVLVGEIVKDTRPKSAPTPSGGVPQQSEASTPSGNDSSGENATDPPSK